MPEDREEIALTLNGRKRNLERRDFDALIENLHKDQRTAQNVYAKFASSLKGLHHFLDLSFLSMPLREDYKKIISENAIKIGLA